ncbi:hypothetical protein [Luedemannella flava]
MLVTLHTMVTVPGGWNAVLSGAVSWASAPVLLNLAAVLGWLLWAWALYEVGAAAVDRMRLLRRTRPALPPRAQSRVAALTGTAVLLLDAITRFTSGAGSPATPTAVTTVDTGLAGQSIGDNAARLPQDSVSPSVVDESLDTDGQSAGVEVRGGWLPTSTATAIAAAAAGLWLARRRRYVPRTPGARYADEPFTLPAGVLAVRRAVHAAATDDDAAPWAVLASAPVVATAGATPHGPLLLADLPRDGLGLVGPGAAAAARAALVAATAARWPVAGVANDLTALLGGSAATNVADLLTAIVAPDLATALTLAASRAAIGPLLLLATSPPPGPTADRLTTLVARAGLTAVLLGGWPAGTTWHVDTDGTTRTHPVGAAPVARLGVLDPATTGDILATLAAAHDRPANGQAGVGRPASAPNSLTSDNVIPHERDGASRLLRLQVLGRPSLQRSYPDGSWGEVHLGRAAARQILVYLAAHRDGATTDQLKEVLWPDVASSSARNRFNTTISHLRLALADAAGGTVLQHTIDQATPGETRHWLDPDHIHVDLWQFQDAWARAGTAIDPHTCRQALIDAVDAYHGELAEACRYEWAEPLREELLARAVDAYAHLADLEFDHDAALRLLQQAIRYSPHAEHLYQQAMKRHAAAGNPDGVRRALATLAARLGDVHQQPDPTTIALADTLLAKLAERR